jgi:GNAT superfamily N-acetyltransferase
MSDVTIEPVDPEWFEDVVGLWELAGLTRPWNDSRADLRRAVDGPASIVLIGVHQGRLIATVMVGDGGHRGWVYYLAGTPGAERQGHGRTMMNAAETWLRDRGVAKLNLTVRGPTTPPEAFTDPLGMRPRRPRVLAPARRLSPPKTSQPGASTAQQRHGTAVA